MKRTELLQRTDAAVNETHDALQTVYDALNHGQQKQIIKDDKVKALFDRYEVEYEVS